MYDCERKTWFLTYKKTRILNNFEAAEKPNLENTGAGSHANVSLTGATHLNIGVIQDYVHGKDTSRKRLGNGSRTPDRTQNARPNMTPFWIPVQPGAQGNLHSDKEKAMLWLSIISIISDEL